jgi:hypothetical protein
MAESRNPDIGAMFARNQNSSSSSHPAVLAITQLLMIDSMDVDISKVWHSDSHAPQRAVVQGWISDLVSQRRPHASSEPGWTDALPEVVKRIDKMLYNGSDSLEE